MAINATRAVPRSVVPQPTRADATAKKEATVMMREFEKGKWSGWARAATYGASAA